MNLRTQFTVMFVVATFLQPAVSSTRPVGCIAVDNLSSNLKAIGNRDWDDMDETKVKSIWASELSGIDCNAGACQTIGRKDRVIDNRCQCCELFMFNIERNGNGSVIKEHLRNVVVYYSAPTANRLLGDAKLLARAIGLPDRDAATIGFKETQKFNWTLEDRNDRKVALLEVRLSHKGAVWTAYFILSQQPL